MPTREDLEDDVHNASNAVDTGNALLALHEFIANEDSDDKDDG